MKCAVYLWLAEKIPAGLCKAEPGGKFNPCYSHSMVAGGLEVMS